MISWYQANRQGSSTYGNYPESAIGSPYEPPDPKLLSLSTNWGGKGLLDSWCPPQEPVSDPLSSLLFLEANDLPFKYFHSLGD